VRKAAVVPLVLVIFLSACRNEATNGAGPTTPPPTTEPPPSSPAPTGPPAGCEDATEAGATFSLAMEDYSFEPLCVAVGTEQGPVIENRGSFLHNWTVTGTGISVDVEAGDTFRGEAIGLEPGTYEVFCRYHQTLGMEGVLVVASA